MPDEYHYVYRIDFLEVDNVYFGSRTCYCLPEDDTEYLGSPVTYKHFWELYTPVKTILYAEFKSRTNAVAYENYLIRKQWDTDKSKSLNATIGGCIYNTPVIARSFVGISPEGEIVKFTNATKFCRDNPELGLSYGKISSCAGGHDYTHKGWRFFYQEDYEQLNGVIPPIPEAARWYVAISPDGFHHTFNNSAQFIVDHPEYNFSSGAISDCCRGHIQTHLGWRFFYKEDYDEFMGEIKPPVYKKMKSFVGLSPEGKIYKFTNAKQFIRDNPNFGLHPSHVTQCAKGSIPRHRGWRFLYLEDYMANNEEFPPVKETQYIGISPNGDKYTFSNIKKFCEDNPQLELVPSGISACSRGVYEYYKQWRFYKYEDYDALAC